jgi:predicted metal-binding protein
MEAAASNTRLRGAAMKIAILNCLRANEVCTGSACLRAFNTRTAHFSGYGDTPLELVAMARCNGCGNGLNDGFRKKLDRIVQVEAEVCHLGHCTRRGEPKEECPTITEAARYLEARGVRILRGTH